MTQRPTWRAAWVMLLLIGACGNSSEMTAIRAAEVRERADAAAPEIGRLTLGSRVRVTSGGLLQAKGWARIDGADLKGWVEADRLAPFPIAAEAAFVSALRADVRDAPGDGARVVTALKIGALVQISGASPVAAGGQVAVVQDGVVSGFLDAAAVSTEPVSPARAVAASFAALGKGQRGDALIGAEYAAAVDSPGGAALELLAALVADTDPGRAETLRARAAAPALPDEASPRPPAAPGPAFVWTRTAALREAPQLEGPVRLHLPIGAAVEVVAVTGDFAEVRVTPRPRRRFVVEGKSLQELGTVPRLTASPVDASAASSSAEPLGGYVRLPELSLDGPDPAAVTQSARAAASAGDAGRALELAARAWALAPLDASAGKLLEETAIASGRSELAIRPEVVLGFARTPGPEPIIDVAIFPGCRGSLSRAVVLDLVDPLGYLTGALTVRPKDLRLGAATLSAIPRDACLRELPPAPCVRNIPGQEFEPSPDSEPTPAEMEAIERSIEAEVDGMVSESERRTARYERWRPKLDELFPPRPVVRIRIGNESPAQWAPRRPLFVYGYGYDASGAGDTKHAGPISKESLVVARLPAVVVPPFSALEMWIGVPAYTGVAYGVLEAADEEGARSRASALPVHARWRVVQTDVNAVEHDWLVPPDGEPVRWEASTLSDYCYQWAL